MKLSVEVLLQNTFNFTWLGEKPPVIRPDYLIEYINMSIGHHS